MAKKVAVIAAVVAVVALGAFILYDSLKGKEYEGSFFAMDTVVSVDLTGRKNEELFESVKKETKRLDERVLSKTSESSELHLINSDGVGVAGTDLSYVLEYAKKLEDDSGSSFCAGLGSLVSLWGIGSDSPKVPDDAEIKDALKGCFDWKLSGNTVTLGEGCSLDLGALGKGYACDKIKSLIVVGGSDKAVVSVGGSVLLYSKSPKETFTVGIRDPWGGVDDVAAKLTLGSCCVSTSGSYERNFTADGKTYHHIFSPSTGSPAESGVVSVTVVSDSGLVSDAMSTALFVLGVDKGLDFAAKAGVEAVFITDDGEYICTPGIKDKLTILK